jgi:hypothetical protein
MFGYFETPQSYTVATATIDKEAISIKWHELMRPFFETLDQDLNVFEIEAAALPFPFITQDDGQRVWNEGNIGAGMIAVRSS